MTGDAVIHAGERLVAGAAKMPSSTLHAMFRQFVEQQVLRPEYFARRSGRRTLSSARARRLLQAMLRYVRDFRDGI